VRHPSRVGTVPPSTSTPPWPACGACSRRVRVTGRGGAAHTADPAPFSPAPSAAPARHGLAQPWPRRGPQARPRPKRPPPARRAVKAIAQDAADPIRRLLLAGRLGTRRRPGGGGGAQGPADTPTDPRGPSDLVRETPLVRRSRQAIPWERPAHPGGAPSPDRGGRTPSRDERGPAARGERAPRPPRQAPAALGRPQGIPRHLRSPLTSAPDAGGEDRQHRWARRAR
jgi:hypothetical protein